MQMRFRIASLVYLITLICAPFADFVHTINTSDNDVVNKYILCGCSVLLLLGYSKVLLQLVDLFCTPTVDILNTLLLGYTFLTDRVLGFSIRFNQFNKHLYSDDSRLLFRSALDQNMTENENF